MVKVEVKSQQCHIFKSEGVVVLWNDDLFLSPLFPLRLQKSYITLYKMTYKTVEV
jgi:hypothetical protein